jgi:hypothetical protein
MRVRVDSCTTHVRLNACIQYVKLGLQATALMRNLRTYYICMCMYDVCVCIYVYVYVGVFYYRIQGRSSLKHPLNVWIVIREEI